MIVDGLAFRGSASRALDAGAGRSCFLPGYLAVSVRRLHDLDMSGGFIFLTFIPLIGILMIVWACQRGTPARIGSAWARPVRHPEVFA